MRGGADTLGEEQIPTGLREFMVKRGAPELEALAEVSLLQSVDPGMAERERFVCGANVAGAMGSTVVVDWVAVR